ncbi:UDP-glucose iridoid glucosyltransferase-like [Punica granatum]|uniref:UDP-glucose iridoid glucosyltransferase-like n=2 Tax=Punica granatum TaxID=22663 RepID=A0A6P8CQU9_PUNGR|nr:UDP-glucose iridoid glucosyltransferase-like [Punica granatum]
MEKSPGKLGRIVLVPCPAQGHLSPILQLGAVLHSQYGLSITVVHTNFNFPKNQPPPFRFISMPDHLSDEDISSNDFINVMSKLNINCKVPFRDVLGNLVQQAGGEEAGVACVIYDGVMHFPEEVARELGIQSMVFRTLCAGNIRIYKEYPRLVKEGYIPVHESKSLDDVPGLHPLRLKDLPVYKLKGYEGLLRLLEKACETGSSSTIIINTTEALDREALMELQKQHHIPVLAVGPLHKIAPPVSSSLLEEDGNCIRWLDKQAKNSVLYVSIGSIASVDEKELIEMAWGLANSKQPFLWVIRPGSVCGSEWTELLPEGFNESIRERGLIIKWAPQKEVLAHESTGGFWSHCGWNSTLESISEGVPMICTPSFGDQRVNTRYLCHVWKVGIVVENMERKEIDKAVRKLMVGEEGEMVRQRMMELKTRVDCSIKEGGSSDNSLHELVNLIPSV